MQLVCPAGNYPSAKAAIDHGADAIYIGFKDETNARHFAGLNFNEKSLAKTLDYAKQKQRKVYIAINTYPQNAHWARWKAAVDSAADLGADAIIVADIGVLNYASQRHPDLPRHLSVQGSATNVEALNFYHQHFAIQRAVLPRVLSLKQVAQVAEQSPVRLEVFGFGSLCVMVEGRCYLSSYVTGESPNTCGACSPAAYVRWQENKDQTLESRLNGVLIDRYQSGEAAGYPTLCKGRFQVNGERFHALEEPTSLNTLRLLPDLLNMGIDAIKIEGRQRSPAYVAQVAQVWRQAIDAAHSHRDSFRIDPKWDNTLSALSEGHQTTLGAYARPWQ